MSVIERLLLAVKRRETPAARLAHRVYKKLLAADVPDNMAARTIFGSLHAGHHFMSEKGELAVSKLLYAPMLRSRCESVGRDLAMASAPYIRGHARIAIGDRCSFKSFALQTGRFVDEPRITFGDDCAVGKTVHFSLNKRIQIGQGVVVADRAGIQDSDGHPSNVERRLRGEHLNENDIAPVTIGDHAWIGHGAHILKGVTIGRGAIVMAGSVVVSDVADGAIVMGVPARVVKR